MIFINLYYIFGYVVIIVFNSIIFIHFLVLLEPYFVNFFYKARFCFVVSFYCLFCSLNFWALLFLLFSCIYSIVYFLVFGALLLILNALCFKKFFFLFKNPATLFSPYVPPAVLQKALSLP